MGEAKVFGPQLASPALWCVGDRARVQESLWLVLKCSSPYAASNNVLVAGCRDPARGASYVMLEQKGRFLSPVQFCLPILLYKVSMSE